MAVGVVDPLPSAHERFRARGGRAFLALWTPAVVLAPFAGWLVDRLDARPVLIAASLAQAAVAASLASVLDSTAAILVLTVLLGVGFAVAQPAEFSLGPVIGGETARLIEVNGLVETARYGGCDGRAAAGRAACRPRRDARGHVRQRGELPGRRAGRARARGATARGARGARKARRDTRLARRGSAAPRTGEAGRRSLPAEACGEPRSVPGVSRSTNGPWVLTTWRAK